MPRHATLGAVAGALCLGAAAPHAAGVDEARYRDARAMIERAVDYLFEQQDEATGGWAVNPDGPDLPAISSLVLTGMLMERDLDANDPRVARGVDYVLAFRQPDGGIYDRVLANYNTAISLSMLARVETAEAGAAIPPAHAFLRSIQWSEDAIAHPETGAVDTDHAFYGGVGYGGSGRPDLSNLSLMLQGLHDSGLDADDEAYQRAVTFLERIQMSDRVNDRDYAEGSSQGGFIYSTSPNGEPQNIGVGESKAGMIEEVTPDGERISRLRAYGSMTYAGFKSYIFADLDRDDERVRLAYDWIRRHYTLEENPGIGTDGYYYYLVTFARALDAWGATTLTPIGPDGAPGEPRDWANDLIDRLGELQNGDGSFRSVDDRWMEGNPVLITAYALLALQHAID